MEIKRTVLKPEARETPRSSFSKYAATAVLAAGLILPSTVSADENKPNPRVAAVYREMAKRMDAEESCSETLGKIPPKTRIKRLHRDDGTISQTRVESRVVRKGDWIKLQGLSEEHYLKVNKITDKGLGITFDGKKRSADYDGFTMLDEFQPTITVFAQRCSKNAALLTISYPISPTKADPGPSITAYSKLASL